MTVLQLITLHRRIFGSAITTVVVCVSVNKNESGSVFSIQSKYLDL